MSARIAEATGSQPPGPLHTFSDVDASVRRQLDRLRETPHLVGGDTARGLVYEVGTGRLREVTP